MNIYCLLIIQLLVYRLRDIPVPKPQTAPPLLIYICAHTHLASIFTMGPQVFTRT